MLSIDSIQLEAKQTALVVIDIQEKLLAAMPKDVAAGMVKNAGILLQTANEFNMPVILTEQYPKGLGPTVPEIKKLTKGITSIEKMSFSCCGVNNFLKAIDDTKAQNLILCGMETHICIFQTVIDLLEDEWDVFVPADAVCSINKLDWKYGLKIIRQAGGVVGTTQMFVFQMLGEAGSDRFKRLSKLF